VRAVNEDEVSEGDQLRNSVMFRVVDAISDDHYRLERYSEIERREIELWGFGLLPNQLGACLDLRKRPGTKEGGRSTPTRATQLFIAR
jgi:hypothetical protein